MSEEEKFWNAHAGWLESPDPIDNDCLRCEGRGEVVDSVTCEGPWYKECDSCNGTGKKL